MDAVQKIIESAGGTWIGILSCAFVGWLLSKVEVSKLQINPWTAIRKWIGDTFGKEHAEKISGLEKDVGEIKTLIKSHIEDSDRRNADRARRLILAFERELQWDVKHSGEEFQDILETVRQYEAYCANHPEYKNHVAEYAAAHIKETYQERLRNHDFLKDGNRENFR